MHVAESACSFFLPFTRRPCPRYSTGKSPHGQRNKNTKETHTKECFARDNTAAEQVRGFNVAEADRRQDDDTEVQGMRPPLPETRISARERVVSQFKMRKCG